jgi:nucleotide-binding universal stress UspA family protein
VNIKSMLMRLESALNRNDLVDKLILLPGRAPVVHPPISWPQSAIQTTLEQPALDLQPTGFQSAWETEDDSEPFQTETQAEAGGETKANAINLVVGYNSSPKSHAALDLTLWIAHQTRLVTRQPVVVQVVYVLESQQPHAPQAFTNVSLNSMQREIASPVAAGGAPPCALLPQSAWRSGRQGSSDAAQLAPERNYIPDAWSAAESLGFADRVLWQARCLANEWRGSLKTHLRFGELGQELLHVINEEGADLLILGCHHANHPLLQQWGEAFPCPVLGIPQPECDGSDA